jgi:quercetin dioxygenase-like cupin family protein
MENPTVTKYADVNEFRRGNGVITRLLVGKSANESTIFTSGTTLFPSGCSAPFHSHNCAEQVTVMSGNARVEVGDVHENLGPMDTTYIPAEQSHRFVNIGDDDLVILWVYGARDVTRTFTETGETVAHMAAGDQV